VSGSGLLIIVILFALFWLLLIRPQRRRAQAQNRLIANLETGDEIVTAGGLYGTIVGVGDEELMVEIAPGTHVRVARRAVAARIEPEDEEEEEEDEPEEALDAAGEPASADEKAR
jgi:preprotein translocase subunit YajC